MKRSMKRPHIVLFSQSGEEIYKLCQYFQRLPDIIVTNQDQWDKIYFPLRLAIEEEQRKNPDYFNPWRIISTVDRKATVRDYEEIFSELENPLITLHGWLKIIPPKICEKYTIYNGHPALIGDYPELKGKDPVEKIWENIGKYRYMGSVIHEVTAGVDEGKIVETVCITTGALDNKQQVYTRARYTSLECWKKFLQNNF